MSMHRMPTAGQQQVTQSPESVHVARLQALAGTYGHLQAEADLFLVRFVTLSGTGMEGASRKTQAEQNTAARQAAGQCPSSSGPGR